MKRLDWNAMPRGTMTNEGEFIGIAGKYHAFILSGFSMMMIEFDKLRIEPSTRWTYHDGGECPLPDGVTFDMRTRAGFEWGETDPKEFNWCHYSSDGDIIAYRITGVDRAGGWTDKPEEVTE